MGDVKTVSYAFENGKQITITLLVNILQWGYKKCACLE